MKTFYDKRGGKEPGFKALLRSGKTPAISKTKGEFPEELL